MDVDDEVLPRNTHFAQSETFRKSAFGRTNLFLKSSSALFREIRAPTTSARQADTSIFHLHRGNNESDKPDNCACWHCCHGYGGAGFRLPRVYDPAEQIYHVYGWFCSANCAKAYILEHSTFDRGYQINIFVRMLREVYKIEQSIEEAPPRLSLRMFGGPFDIESFRKQTNTCSIVTPPFVSYCMLIEERHPSGTIPITEQTISSSRGTVRGLTRPIAKQTPCCTHDLGEPQNTGMYANFLRDKNSTTATTERKEDACMTDALDQTPEVGATRKRSSSASTSQPKRPMTGLGKFAVEKK